MNNDTTAGITKTSKTVYSLRDKTTGALACIDDFDPNEDGFGAGNACFIQPGGPRVSLPRFEVDSWEKAAYVKVVNTPKFNSTREAPTWSQQSMENFEVVKIVTTVEITPEVAEPPAVFHNAIDNWCELSSSMKGRVEVPEGPGMEYVRVYAVPMPEGETLESVRAKCAGKKVVISGSYTWMAHAYGIIELAPEQLEQGKGRAFGIVAQVEHE